MKSINELPRELEPVLALICHVNELGISKWYEVVYYVEDGPDWGWNSYGNSNTFKDGEVVLEWKYATDCFKD